MGLIKTGLKAAIAVKTAHMVHERIERRQQASPTAEAAAPAVSSPPSDVIDQLERLGRLRDADVLSQEEFETQKARILDGR
ncbi:SHOCT domain-containing protein [Streptacidiphilus jiangxiensis]|uniref:Short C-terminal domain-containing protein n=1 Tax=Streptacidiphilus jiangxiensis TaxID=235985 RepID=A0A1H7WEX0_STRJI|nr:SHOCT domain-containing protein [Streptacidiphilus jiangxiensis]SEM20116.1 Short C-terminal domain-containing protein [Streptacidiphilus jiangxiensis]